MRQLEVNGKQIYVVDNHHETLIALSMEWRSRNHSALNMLTLDQHCDVLPAFGRCCTETNGDMDETRRRQLIKQFTPADPAQVEGAIKLLRHDEHIDLALRGGLLCNSGIISKENFTAPAHDKIYISCDAVWPETTLLLNHPEAHEAANSQVLQDDFLHRQLQDLYRLGAPDYLNGDEAFLLDIDLDYFMDEAALSLGGDQRIFRDLFRRAEYVTVSLEECWVKIMRPRGKNYTSQELLDKLLNLFSQVI